MEYENILNEQLNNIIDESQFYKVIEDTNKLTNGFASEFTPEMIMQSIIKGESIFDYKKIITSLEDLFLLEIRNALIICIEIISICILEIIYAYTYYNHATY